MTRFWDMPGAPWQPHAGQRAFLESPSQFRVLACGRRWGKTDACAALITAELFGETPTRHIILAPTLDQARLLFERVESLVRELCAGSPAQARVRRTPHPEMRFRGHTVSARSGALGRALRGNEATHIVVDEAAFVPEELISEVAMPMLATTRGELTLISTPRGKNHFWRFFEMGLRGEHGIWSRRAPSAESPCVRPEFLSVQRELISERAYQVEYEAAFLDDSGRVFGTDAIDACLVAALPRPAAPPFTIGIDFGRYRDFTAAAVVSGNSHEASLVETVHMNSLSWSEMVSRLALLIERYPSARVLCDATGLGDPLVESLRVRMPGRAIGEFVFTAHSKGPLIEGLRCLIENGRFAMRPDPELIRQLQHYEASTGKSGQMRFGAAGGYHDDLVIALALAARELPRPYRAAVTLGGTREFAKCTSTKDQRRRI